VTEGWVLNASPIILLAKIKLIQLVPKLAEPLVIPEPVAEEVLRGPVDDPGAQWLSGPGNKFRRPAAIEPQEFAELGIGAGERSVIAWALAHPGFAAIMDDAAARSHAQVLGVVVFGTVRVLLRLKVAGLIPEVKSPLLQMRQAGGHITDALLEEALNQAGEGPRKVI
jgi:predicted nucleic acid-binding protein